jgi:hypothetical protein
MVSRPRKGRMAPARLFSALRLFSTTDISIGKPFLFMAIALATALFVFGGQSWSPGLGARVPRGHWFVRFSSIAVIAVSYVKALPRTHVFMIACLGAAVGGLHELFQALTPARDAEPDDFLVNAAGAAFGALAFRLLFALLQRVPGTS